LTSLSSPLLAFRSSPEYHHSGAAAPGPLLQFPCRRLPLLRSLPLRRFPDSGQPLTPEGYQPSGYGAFSAFLTLSRPSSARCLPALFHAGPAHGVSPSGPLSPTERAILSDVSPLLRLVRFAATASSAQAHRPPRIYGQLAQTALREAALCAARPTSGFTPCRRQVLCSF